MTPLTFAKAGQALNVLCLGAHSDDIEIGLGGTLLSWISSGMPVHVHWCVFSACGPRHAEAIAGATAILEGAASCKIECKEFRDGYFPYEGAAIKDWMEDLKNRIHPDVVFTHRHDDAHQDHREICRLTWNAFRNHNILEYEIPKWDGDLGQPNVYIPISEAVMERKLAVLHTAFGTQRGKDWFDAETFRGLARLRGMECRSPHRYAEAFVARKLILSEH
jgi:LmbE family N-acetylglucosaminyl deacetylase